MTTPKPGTHCARLLDVLSDGTWHTTSNLHRRAGHMIVHSRISDLRGKGYRIEHGTVAGRVGAQAHRYRWLDAPTHEDADENQMRLDTDMIAPRIPSERYRLFRVRNGGPPEIVCTVGSEEELGPAIMRLGEEGEFDDYCLGIQDAMARWEGLPEHEGDTRYGRFVGKWLVKPWQKGTW